MSINVTEHNKSIEPPTITHGISSHDNDTHSPIEPALNKIFHHVELDVSLSSDNLKACSDLSKDIAIERNKLQSFDSSSPIIEDKTIKNLKMKESIFSDDTHHPTSKAFDKKVDFATEKKDMNYSENSTTEQIKKNDSQELIDDSSRTSSHTSDTSLHVIEEDLNQSQDDPNKDSKKNGVNSTTEKVVVDTDTKKITPEVIDSSFKADNNEENGPVTPDNDDPLFNPEVSKETEKEPTISRRANILRTALKVLFVTSLVIEAFAALCLTEIFPAALLGSPIGCCVVLSVFGLIILGTGFTLKMWNPKPLQNAQKA